MLTQEMAEQSENERQRKEEAGWVNRGRRSSIGRGIPLGKGARGGGGPTGAQKGANKDHVPTEADKELLRELHKRPPAQ